jgi:hypothetical protein
VLYSLKAAMRASSCRKMSVTLENVSLLVMGRVMRELRTSTGDPVIKETRSANKDRTENMTYWKVISYSVIYVIANAMAMLSTLATSVPLEKVMTRWLRCESSRVQRFDFPVNVARDGLLLILACYF